MNSLKIEFQCFIQLLQDEICKSLEELDGQAVFCEDLWERGDGGGGRSRVISKGAVFEKGGVNISSVYGKLPISMREYLKTDYDDFFACGLSLVLHPVNPYVPTVHANYRYFELYNKEGCIVDQWFGGGSDLTPYYYFKDDKCHIHDIQKSVCDKSDITLYPRFKEACDRYFYNSHRNEARGVGGLFYDYLRPEGNRDARFWFDLVTSLARVFLPSYIPIVEQRKSMSYSYKEKFWQEIRRGRYAEFNLIHDKGTLFGLKTNGRIESILMSLPPRVRWEYDFEPESGSPEEALLLELRR